MFYSSLRLQQLAVINARTPDRPPRLLRVAVDSGGCSGFAYQFTLEEESAVEEEDLVFEEDGAKVVVDDVSLEFIEGATIDC